MFFLYALVRVSAAAAANLDDYALIHKPWTGVLGVRVRQLEQPNPGTYGGIVRRWLPHRAD